MGSKVLIKKQKMHNTIQNNATTMIIATITTMTVVIIRVGYYYVRNKTKSINRVRIHGGLGSLG